MWLFDWFNKRKINKLSARTGMQVIDGTSIDETLPELQGPAGLEMYRKMRRNDPVIGGMMLNIETIYRRLRYNVIPTGTSRNHERAYRVVNESVAVAGFNINRMMYEMATAFVYGFYVGERVYEVDGFRVYIKDVEPRHSLTITRIDLDRRFVEQVTTVGIREIPTTRCVLWSINAEGRSPFGVSLLRPLYKPYYYKVQVEAAEGATVDRDIGGLPVMHACPGFDFNAATKGSPNYDPLVEATLNWALNTVTNLRKGKQQGVVIPDGWKLELLRSEGASALDTDKIIRRYNTEMAVGLLQGFLAAGGFSSTNQANVKETKRMFLNAFDAFAQEMATVMNVQVFQPLCEYNGLDAKYAPKIEVAPVKESDLASLASFVARLVAQGVITPTTTLERSLLDIADLPYDPDNVKETEEG